MHSTSKTCDFVANKIHRYFVLQLLAVSQNIIYTQIFFAVIIKLSARYFISYNNKEVHIYHKFKNSLKTVFQ